MFENLWYIEGVRTALEVCMDVKSGEEVLVVTDSRKLDIADAFAAVSSSFGADTTISCMKPREIDGEEPTEAIAGAMKKADVVMIPTSKSLSHTDAREEAVESGARVASMPGITKKMLATAMTAGYKKIEKKSKKLAKILTDSNKAKISTDKGTDLILELEGRKGIADTGMLQEKGAWGNLPAGEAYIAPLEGKGRGTIVVDTSMSGVGKISEPITIEVVDGKITEIRGKEEAQEFKDMIQKGDENGDKIAELGIGTNEVATAMGNALIDEKLGGTVHVAFGDSSHIGGCQMSNIHSDGIISEPTLKLDETTVLEKGEWKI
ncbi:MAG: aminopeptidase [Candidatus Natronoplasma sp.]